MVRVLVQIACSVYRSVFLCSVQLVVQSALAVLDAAIHALSDAIQSAIKLLRTMIRGVIETGEGAVDVAVDSVNMVAGLFGGHVDEPKMSVPDLEYVQLGAWSH